jgi:hypothetical protein
VEEEAFARGLKDHLLQDIHNDVEKERREGITLPKPAAALNPSAGDSIEEDSCLARLV